MKGEPHDKRRRTQADRDAARTARDIVRVTRIRQDLARRPASEARDEVMTLVDQELAALRDPGYQRARLEAERCLAFGQQVPGWAMKALSKRPKEGATRMSQSEGRTP
jgi:hypothetical protein